MVLPSFPRHIQWKIKSKSFANRSNWWDSVTDIPMWMAWPGYCVLRDTLTLLEFIRFHSLAHSPQSESVCEMVNGIQRYFSHSERFAAAVSGCRSDEIGEKSFVYGQATVCMKHIHCTMLSLNIINISLVDVCAFVFRFEWSVQHIFQSSYSSCSHIRTDISMAWNAKECLLFAWQRRRRVREKMGEKIEREKN